MLTSLFEVAELLTDLPDDAARSGVLLLRVVDAEGAGRQHLGAVRTYRPGSPPAGVVVGAAVHAVLDRHAQQQVRAREPAHLLLLGHPAGGSVTVLVQLADQLPPVAWDLLRARCPLVLSTTPVAGGLLTTAAVRLPEGVAASGSTTGTGVGRDGPAPAGRVIVERLDPAPRLALLGHGVLVDALVAAADLMRWHPQVLPRFAPGDLQHLNSPDVLLVVIDDPETRWRAARSAAGSRVGYVGVVCPSRTRADPPSALRDGLNLLDAGDVLTRTPHDAALLLLDQVLHGHRRPGVDDTRMLVFDGG